MFKKERFHQFFKFILVGLANTVLDISIYGVLRQLANLNPIVSSVTTVSLVICFSYIANAKYVFRNEPNIQSFIKFVFTTGLGILIIQSFLSATLEGRVDSVVFHFFGNGEKQTFIGNSFTRIMGVAFSLIWNFLFYKYIVFKLEKFAPDEPIEKILN